MLHEYAPVLDTPVRPTFNVTVRGLGGVAILLSMSAFAVGYAGARLFPPEGVYIHVRWASTVDAAARETLARRFHLDHSMQLEEATYHYLLNDVSTANICDMVKHPAVADTQDIERSTCTASATAEWATLDSTTRLRSRQMTQTARLLGTGAAGLGILALLLVAAPASMQRLRHRMSSTAKALYARVPEVSAEGAGLFRIVFGSAVVLLFALLPIASGDIPNGPQAAETSWVMRLAGDLIISRPRIADVLTPWLWISGALFVAGAYTRLSFAAFTAGAITWGVAYSLRSGHHPVSALLVALICLIPSRWGDAWSIDAWLRHRRSGGGGRPAARAALREYGYTVWIPGVVLGVAFLSAAVSKLQVGGIGWILNGTVKYHFVTDSPNAPVDWGLRFGIIPSVAVALSFGAVAVETLALPAAVLGPWIVRLLVAVAVVPMLAGFWFFQGVFWPAWWMLLLSFAPWHLVPSRGPGAAAVHVGAPKVRLRHAQLAFLTLAIVQQLVASALRLEAPPFVSAYDMYSKTYDTPAEYPSTGGTSYVLVAAMTDGTTDVCRMDDDDGLRLGSVPASEFGQAATAFLGRCFSDVRAIHTLAIEERRPRIDWDAGRFLGIAHVALNGPVALPTTPFGQLEAR